MSILSPEETEQLKELPHEPLYEQLQPRLTDTQIKQNVKEETVKIIQPQKINKQQKTNKLKKN